MEQRKLIQHGLSSLTVALPIKWLKEHDLRKGEEVFIDIEGNKLILSTKAPLKHEKASVDVSKLDRTSILLYIQSLYRFGYNEIDIRFRKQKTIHYRTGKEVSISSVVHQIVNRCIGAEVIEQSEGKILVKSISKETDEDFKVILRRAFLLMMEASETLLLGIKENDKDKISTIEDMHDNVNKFVSYCLRLLNKYGHEDVKKTGFYHHIIASVDKIMDILKYNARDILEYNKKISKETMQVWEEINKSIRGYYDLFYDFSMEKVDALSKNRDKTKTLLKEKAKRIPHEELLFLTSQKQVLEIILDLTDFRMGLEN